MQWWFRVIHQPAILKIIKDKADKIIADKKYHIMDVYFKKYPVCRHLHSSIDATIRLYNQMKLKQVKSEDIKSINY